MFVFRQYRHVTNGQKRLIAANQQWRCAFCNVILPACFEVDHRCPLHAGGGNDCDNLQALCPACHGMKTYKENVYRKINYKYVKKRHAWQCTTKKITNKDTFGLSPKKRRTRVEIGLDLLKLEKLQKEIQTLELLCNKDLHTYNKYRTKLTTLSDTVHKECS